MFESFTEKLADGTFKAELLSHVVSFFEEEQQDLKKPEPARQYNLQLWLLAQMRQPGRSIYKDFDRSTFSDFLRAKWRVVLSCAHPEYPQPAV